MPTGPEVVMHGVPLHNSREAHSAKQEDDTFEEMEGTPEEVPET